MGDDKLGRCILLAEDPPGVSVRRCSPRDWPRYMPATDNGAIDSYAKAACPSCLLLQKIVSTAPFASAARRTPLLLQVCCYCK